MRASGAVQVLRSAHASRQSRRAWPPLAQVRLHSRNCCVQALGHAAAALPRVAASDRPTSPARTSAGRCDRLANLVSCPARRQTLRHPRQALSLPLIWPGSPPFRARASHGNRCAVTLHTSPDVRGQASFRPSAVPGLSAVQPLCRNPLAGGFGTLPRDFLAWRRTTSRPLPRRTVLDDETDITADAILSGTQPRRRRASCSRSLTPLVATR